MTVLVTGGSGYLGSLTLAALTEDGGPPPVAVDVRPPARPVPGVTYVEADLRHADLTDLLTRHEVEAVVHLAAIVEPPPGMTDDELHDIEVGGARRVVAACVAAGVDHLTVVSSGAAYGFTPDNLLRARVETDPTPGHPHFAYSRHKAEVEALLDDVRRDHPALGLLVLRPGTVLGAGTDNRITRLFTAPVVTGLRGTATPFVLVWDRDVAATIRRGVRERITGTYNLAGDGVLTLRDIAAVEARPYLTLPPALVRCALTAAARTGRSRYGPQEVDFLRYRPVLDNAAWKAAFPGLPRLTTAEVYGRFRAGRAPRGDATAVVTGAGGHVGRELVRLLAAAGHDVVGVDRPGVAAPPEVDACLEVDLTDAGTADRLRDAVADRGGLDLLVHAAGVTALGGLATTAPEDDATVAAVNYLAPLAMTRALLDDLAAAGGHVVVLSSLAGVVPAAGRPAYVGAKHALTGAFRAVAPELAARGVAVTVLHPSFLRTPVTTLGAGTERTTVGPALDPDDVARVAVRAVVGRHQRSRRPAPVRRLVGLPARLVDLLHRLAPEATVRAGARRLGRATGTGSARAGADGTVTDEGDPTA